MSLNRFLSSALRFTGVTRSRAVTIFRSNPLFAGPIFSREALTSPRQFRHYLLRSGYVALLLVLMWTARQAMMGLQTERNLGDIARLGTLVFQILSVVQLTLMSFFALLFAAGSVAQEKDRGTLVLLLMTDLRDHELVLGKLLSSFLNVGVLLLASLPLFAMLQFLGGVGLDQILWTLILCAGTALAAGSWGALVAFWRDKTFQTLAISVLGAVVFLGAIETAVVVSGGHDALVTAATILNPYRGLFELLSPLKGHAGLDPVHVSAWNSVTAMFGLAALLSFVATWRLRAWNPSQMLVPHTEEDADTGKRRTKHREIWSNPIIWREMRTRAYGRKIAVIKFAYLVLAAVVTATMGLDETGESAKLFGVISSAGVAFLGLGILSLMLINAQAVTAITGERDGKTLELLLATDITAPEFIFGKLGGVFYNTKELILIPLLLAGLMLATGGLTAEHGFYVITGYLVLVTFAAMLGLHAGLCYENSRSAIATGLGTMFFLFIGMLIFMLLLVEARGSFLLQLPNFLVFVVVGSIALHHALAHKHPSTAFVLASMGLPFLTFYCITEFLLGGSLGVWLWLSVAYGFTTLAMLIPAVSDFDFALGRATLDRG